MREAEERREERISDRDTCGRKGEEQRLNQGNKDLQRRNERNREYMYIN